MALHPATWHRFSGGKYILCCQSWCPSFPRARVLVLDHPFLSGCQIWGSSCRFRGPLDNAWRASGIPNPRRLGGWCQRSPGIWPEGNLTRQDRPSRRGLCTGRQLLCLQRFSLRIRISFEFQFLLEISFCVKFSNHAEFQRKPPLERQPKEGCVRLTISVSSIIGIPFADIIEDLGNINTNNARKIAI